jgi:hypothetical protein
MIVIIIRFKCWINNSNTETTIKNREVTINNITYEAKKEFIGIGLLTICSKYAGATACGLQSLR